MPRHLREPSFFQLYRLYTDLSRAARRARRRVLIGSDDRVEGKCSSNLSLSQLAVFTRLTICNTSQGELRRGESSVIADQFF